MWWRDWLWWKQFIVYTIMTVVGMFISHYIPTEYFPYWVPTSLLLGHAVNIWNYRKRISKMKRVYTLEEAKGFFLSNSSGSVICINDGGLEKVCSCYPKAVEFYGG